MEGGRALNIAAAGFAGAVAGVLLGVAALIGIVFFVSWLTRDSTSTRARKQAQALFDGGGKRTATVKSCTKIGSDEEALIYRCQILAPDCVRTHRFEVYRDQMYGVAPYSVSTDVGNRPCRYPSD